MRSVTNRTLVVVAALGGLAVALGCGAPGSSVVIYCSLDQVYAEPLLKKFETESGIRVLAQYDLEAQKTTGLVNRILAESTNPQCDVYWNNEIVQTFILKEKGALQPYVSPNAAGIPDEFKDKDGLWTGLAARARVLLVNKDKMPAAEAPKSIRELISPKFKGKVALAKPIFGTTFTHSLALWSLWGNERAGKFFDALQKNDVQVCEGNAQVMNAVANGDIPCGLTDTDDASVAVRDGKPVDVVFLDQGDSALGTLVIPNTVMLLGGAPHPEFGKKLIDFILSVEVEEALAAGTSVQMPLHRGAKVPAGVRTVDSIRAMKVDWAAAASRSEEVARKLQDTFVR